MSEESKSRHGALVRLARMAGIAEGQMPQSEAMWEKFLDVVSDTLFASDRDRELLERAIEITSEEMMTLNDEIEAEKQLLMTALGSLSTIVVHVSNEGQIQYSNGALVDVTGLETDVSGMRLSSVLEFRSGDAPIPIMEIAWGLSREGSWSRERCEVIHPNGGIIADVTLASVTHHGERDGFVVSIADVTDRIAALELADAAILEAEAARRAREAQGRFLANMSHELRTPLTAIIGYSELLAEEHPDYAEDPVDDYARILDASGHLVGLINDVLDMSKIQTGNLEVDLELVSAEGPISRAVNATQPTIQKNGNELALEIDRPLPMVEVDPMRLTQVLVNLLGNAGKFTSDGMVTLRASDADGALVIEVVDTGIGIAPEKIEDLFSPFTQADSSTTRRYGGTGLGLAIARQLTEAMNGMIEATSVPGEGSTFRICLPAAQPDSATHLAADSWVE